MKYKILIVDDEPANLRVLERLFRDEHEVLTATSGAEALAALENHDVALLISDQRMPEMSGIELVGRTVSLRPHMVRILLTGYTDVSSLIEAINCGHVYKYVTKPWNNEDLVITVSRALSHYEATKSLHNLEMVNHRLRARLNEIAELATTDDELLPESRLNAVVRERQLDVISPN
ncbi:MAG TPA: response regulator [Pyrinomonadaceae bacterium]|jgi:two-component system response regulator HupR/HoxA